MLASHYLSNGLGLFRPYPATIRNACALTPATAPAFWCKGKSNLSNELWHAPLSSPVVLLDRMDHVCQNVVKPAYNPITQQHHLAIMPRIPLQFLNRYIFYTMSNTDDDQLPACLASTRQAVEQLSAMYQQLGLEEEGKDFMTEIFTPMLASLPDPNDLEDQLEHGDVTNLKLMKLSCAYVVGAISAETAGNHENAWIAVSHAQYWMGVAYGLGFMKGAGKQALIERGRAGGKQAHKNQYGELQKKARELAMQHLEWSRMQAARLITPEVVEASRTMANVQPIRAKDPVETIYEWLEGLSFGKKRKPRRKNTKG